MTMGRRKRQWVSVEVLSHQMTSSQTPAFLVDDLLANMPGSQERQSGLTISHIFGWAQAIASAESSPSATGGHLSAGITFVPASGIAALAAGDASIPDPSVVSSQESAWWWRWKSPRIFSDPDKQPASVSFPYYPPSQATIPINIRSMRKVPAGMVPVFVGAQEGWVTTHEPLWFVWLRLLVLLP